MSAEEELDRREQIIELYERQLAQRDTEMAKLRWTLDNIYTIARREVSGRHDPRERWRHVLRLCEAVGCQPRGVLREGLYDPENEATE